VCVCVCVRVRDALFLSHSSPLYSAIHVGRFFARLNATWEANPPKTVMEFHTLYQPLLRQVALELQDGRFDSLGWPAA